MGEGLVVYSTKIGMYKGHVRNSVNGKAMMVSLGDTMCVPDLKINLLSLTKVMDKGTDFYSRNGNIYIKCGEGKEICFNKQNRT